MSKKIRLNDYADLIRITLTDILVADTDTNGSVLSVVPLENEERVSVKINEKEYSFTLAELKLVISSVKKFLALLRMKTGL